MFREAFRNAIPDKFNDTIGEFNVAVSAVAEEVGRWFDDNVATAGLPTSDDILHRAFSIVTDTTTPDDAHVEVPDTVIELVREHFTAWRRIHTSTTHEELAEALAAYTHFARERFPVDASIFVFMTSRAMQKTLRDETALRASAIEDAISIDGANPWQVIKNATRLFTDIPISVGVIEALPCIDKKDTHTQNHLEYAACMVDSDDTYYAPHYAAQLALVAYQIGGDPRKFLDKAKAIFGDSRPSWGREYHPDEKLSFACIRMISTVEAYVGLSEAGRQTILCASFLNLTPEQKSELLTHVAFIETEKESSPTTTLFHAKEVLKQDGAFSADKAKRLSEIARIQIRAGLLDDAEQTIDELHAIIVSHRHVPSQIPLKAFVHVSDELISVTDAIVYYQRTLIWLSRAYAQQGNLEKARVLADKIQWSPDQRAATFAFIAEKSLPESEDYQRTLASAHAAARQIIDEPILEQGGTACIFDASMGTSTIQKASAKPTFFYNRTLSAIAQAEAHTGDIDAAKKTAQRIVDDEFEYKARALFAIAEAEAKKNKWEDFERTVEELGAEQHGLRMKQQLFLQVASRVEDENKIDLLTRALECSRAVQDFIAVAAQQKKHGCEATESLQKAFEAAKTENCCGELTPSKIADQCVDVIIKAADMECIDFAVQSANAIDESKHPSAAARAWLHIAKKQITSSQDPTMSLARGFEAALKLGVTLKTDLSERPGQDEIFILLIEVLALIKIDPQPLIAWYYENQSKPLCAPEHRTLHDASLTAATLIAGNEKPAHKMFPDFNQAGLDDMSVIPI